MKLSDFDDDYIERLKKRFWAKVDKRGPDDCWEWTGATTSRGYGCMGLLFKGGKRTSLGAHRISVLLHEGAIDDELLACHHCDTTPCVNPRHIFMGTSVDNARDMVEKGRCNNPPGERAPRAKLKRREVKIIMRLLDEGHPQSDIANRFGVSQGAISHIKNKTTWAHINA